MLRFDFSGSISLFFCWQSLEKQRENNSNLTITEMSVHGNIDLLLSILNTLSTEGEFWQIDCIIRLSKSNKRLKCNRKANKQATAHVIVRMSAYHRYSVNGTAKRTYWFRYSVDVVLLLKNLNTAGPMLEWSWPQLVFLEIFISFILPRRPYVPRSLYILYGNFKNSKTCVSM